METAVRPAVDDPPEEPPAASALGYQPALDGVRAIAVAAVLAFHGGFGWASGGYLGVSVFFTLSGFLITRLLLAERAHTGRVDLGRFYARRLRRLLPASALCLTGLIVLSKLGAFTDVANLRRDLVGAAAQVANWTQLTSGRSYADLFLAGASPVDHYWSLAIEEQFYLVWPLAFAALVAGRSRRAIGRIAVVLFALTAIAAPVIAHVWGTDAAYLSTPARLSELFAGVLLAVVTQHRAVPAWTRWLAVAALVAFAGLVAVTPAASGWAYHGGLPLFAVLSAALIAGLQVEGPARRLLSWRPLVFVGTISYGIYLFHWPIFLLADRHLTRVHGAQLFAAKVAITLAVAVVSAAVVERPIRRSRPRPSLTFAAALAVTVAVIAAAVVVAPGRPPAFGAVDGSTAEAVAIRPVAAGSPVPGRAGVDRPVRVLVVGDSTAEVMGAGLVEWAFDHPGVAEVTVDALGGCGLVTGGRFDDFLDDIRAECDRKMHRDLPAAYATLQPDVILISIAAADTWDRRWDDGPPLRPTAPDYARRIRAGYADFFDAAVRAGVPHVVWLRPAVIGTEPKYADPSYDDGSQDLVQDAVEEAVAAHPGRVDVLDFRSWFAASGDQHRLAVRPDGVHLIPTKAQEVAERWLGPQLLDLVG